MGVLTCHCFQEVLCFGDAKNGEILLMKIRGALLLVQSLL